MATQEFVIQTEEELAILGRWWQEKLKLQQWEIVFQLVPKKHTSFVDIDCQARVFWKRAGLQAQVMLMRHEDWASEEFPHDMEKSLVHELLHLVFAPFAAEGEDTEMDIAQEQAIQIISRALIDLKRAGKDILEIYDAAYFKMM
jgi:hypothetical protein